MAKKKDEVAEVKKNEVAAPASVNEYDTNIGMDDLILPRVELLQALSPSVVNDGMAAGTIVNNITKTDLGTPTLIPVTVTKNWIRWRSRAEGGGMVWRSNDPTDERVINESSWGADGSKPLATAYLNFLCLIDGADLPSIVSFCNTSYKTGRKFFTLTKMSPGHLFDGQYKLTAVKKTNTMGTFYVFEIALIGPSTEEQRKQAAAFGQMFAGKELNFEAEGSAKPDTGDDGDEF